jgi:hypothetical protein
MRLPTHADVNTFNAHIAQLWSQLWSGTLPQAPANTGTQLPATPAPAPSIQHTEVIAIHEGTGNASQPSTSTPVPKKPLPVGLTISLLGYLNSTLIDAEIANNPYWLGGAPNIIFEDAGDYFTTNADQDRFIRNNVVKASNSVTAGGVDKYVVSSAYDFTPGHGGEQSLKGIKTACRPMKVADIADWIAWVNASVKAAIDRGEPVDVARSFFVPLIESLGGGVVAGG